LDEGTETRYAMIIATTASTPVVETVHKQDSNEAHDMNPKSTYS